MPLAFAVQDTDPRDPVTAVLPVVVVLDDHGPGLGGPGHHPAAAARGFTPPEVAAVLSLILAINAWNPLGVATHAWEPGSYER